MATDVSHSPITPRLVETLHAEAIALAEDARAYFDHSGQADRDRMSPVLRVAFACEALKVSTRLMQIVAWLLLRRAGDAGELDETALRAPANRLGEAARTDARLIATLPEGARAIIGSSLDLYDRISRLDESLTLSTPVPSPVRGLLDRLAREF